MADTSEVKQDILNWTKDPSRNESDQELVLTSPGDGMGVNVHISYNGHDFDVRSEREGKWESSPFPIEERHVVIGDDPAKAMVRYLISLEGRLDLREPANPISYEELESALRKLYP